MNDIIDAIKGSPVGHLAVMVDNTIHISNLEHMSLCLRRIIRAVTV